ncbi:Uncharacterised protein [Legionella maceachernii]|nr:Uncharacterised protein [Legionella maceachernii]
MINGLKMNQKLVVVTTLLIIMATLYLLFPATASATPML